MTLPEWDRPLPEPAFDGAGQLISHHPAETCRPPCPFHAPSDHHMAAWPLVLIETVELSYPRLMRRCPHGEHHPDPDSSAFAEARGFGRAPHTCDGCCVEPGQSEISSVD